MRILISGSATAFTSEGSERIDDPSVLALLDKASYEDDCCCNYLEMKLVDLGVAGGNVGFAYSNAGGLRVAKYSGRRRTDRAGR
jgi:hypothetical protein